MSQTQSTRVGVIGAGMIARNVHLPALSARSDVDLVGIVTATTESAREAVRRWPIRQAYDSLASLLTEGIDALVVLTPRARHANDVELALGAGVHVLCEKPLAETSLEANSLADLAENVDRTLHVGFNRRHSPVYLRAREVIQSQSPRFIRAEKTRLSSESSGTIENAIHMIDLLRWLCGEPIEVDSFVVPSNRNHHEEGVAAQLLFDSGVVAQFMSSQSAGRWSETLDAFGDATSMHVEAPARIRVSNSGSEISEDFARPKGGFAHPRDVLGFDRLVDQFLSATRGSPNSGCTARDAARSQALVERILAGSKVRRQRSRADATTSPERDLK